MDTAAAQQLLQQAVAHHQAGRLAEAEALYRQILAARPDQPDALHLLGLVAHVVGQHEAAADLIGRSIALRPDIATYHSNLAEVCRALGKPDAAAASARRAVGLDPNNGEAWNNLGACLALLGRIPEAADCFQRATTLRPDHFSAWNNVGNALAHLGRTEESAAAYRRAIALQPTNVEAINSLGAHLLELGRPGEAADWFCKVLALHPTHAHAASNLASALKNQGLLEEAIPWYRKTMEMRPDLAAVHSNMLMSLNYDGDYDNPTLFAEHLAWARQHAASPVNDHPRSRLNAQGSALSRRLRVGYVSADFRHHSVASFIHPLLAAHDHAAFEIVCYFDWRNPDSMTHLIQKHADRWRGIAGQSDEQVARHILADEVDILVDLAGHTANNRLGLFARKPAPLQVSYLGYQNTTGLRTIDYRLTDEWLDPPGATDAFHTEKLLRLPGFFACYQPEENCPEVGPLPALGRSAITFGSFNKLEKISPKTLRLWAGVIAAVPNSRLLLMAPGAEEPLVQQRLHSAFRSRGVAPDRLELLGQRPFMEYMATHNHVDVLLDTFPFSGHTTTCHGLWMGVPIITLVGDRYASRMGLSVLTALGLDDLAAPTEEQFIARATALANDLPRLSALRAGLRQRMRQSPVMDAPALARNIEAAYRRIWEAWCLSRRDLRAGLA
ncbi:MAG: tetratricopeptide repeat protein [Planctomycetota bacterium]